MSDLLPDVIEKVENDLTNEKRRMSRKEYLQPQVEKGDNSRYLRNALDAFNLPAIDISDSTQVADRIGWYFGHCLENDMKPGVVGLCNALGISRVTFFNWMKGSPERREHQTIAQKAKGIIEEMLEQYMMNGKINPVSGIFLMKNNFEGYYDKQEIVVTPNTLEPNRSEDELKALYAANDIEEE